MFGNDSKLLMDFNQETIMEQGMKSPTKILREFQEFLIQKELIEDDYQEDLKLILTELDKYFDKTQSNISS